MSPVGRPEVGQAINVRLGDVLLSHVDAYAYRVGIKRAQAVRRLLQAALAECDAETLELY